MDQTSHATLRSSAHRRALALCSLALLCLGAAVWPGAAHADDDALEKARERYKEGREAYTAQDYPSAVARFEEAYAIKPNSKLLFLISKAYDQMGKSGQALHYLRRYAQSDPAAAAEVKEQLAVYERVVFGRLRSSAALSIDEALDIATPGRHRGSAARTVEVQDSGPVFEDVPVGIYSEPPGAQIFVDDREWGALATTPHNMRMFVGKHKIWVEKDFHVGQSVEIFVRPIVADGKPQTVSFQLERQIVPVEIKTRPPTAEIIYIKSTGERMTLGKGRFNGNLPAGVAKFVVQAPGEGQQTFEESIVASRVDEGGTMFLEFDLRAGTAVSDTGPAKTGKILVSGYLIGADVYVDGARVGVTPGPLEIPVDVGPHKVELKKEGRATWSSMVRVEPEQTTTVTTPENLARADSGGGWFGWVLVGASAGVLGAGGYYTLEALDARDKADEAKKSGTADADSLGEDADKKELISYALFGAGGVVALVGVVVLASSGSGDDGSAALPLDLTPTPGGALVRFNMDFH